MKEVTIPKKLVSLVKAFSVDEQSARLLIIEAAKTICKAQESGFDFDENEISEDELDGIIALMKGIAPRDIIEIIYAAQIVSSHLMGLRLLSHDFRDDQTLGLKLLRFSNEAMIQLQKKKAGGVSQNITVTYNHAGSGRAIIQAVLPRNEICQ